MNRDRRQVALDRLVAAGERLREVRGLCVEAARNLNGTTHYDLADLTVGDVDQIRKQIACLESAVTPMGARS